MKLIKYIAGSLIISFGILLVAIVLLRSLQFDASDVTASHLGAAWVVLAIACYPVAKRIVRV